MIKQTGTVRAQRKEWTVETGREPRREYRKGEEEGLTMNGMNRKGHFGFRDCKPSSVVPTSPCCSRQLFQEIQMTLSQSDADADWA